VVDEYKSQPSVAIPTTIFRVSRSNSRYPNHRHHRCRHFSDVSSLDPSRGVFGPKTTQREEARRGEKAGRRHSSSSSSSSSSSNRASSQTYGFWMIIYPEVVSFENNLVLQITTTSFNPRFPSALLVSLNPPTPLTQEPSHHVDPIDPHHRCAIERCSIRSNSQLLESSSSGVSTKDHGVDDSQLNTRRPSSDDRPADPILGK
jgi:hypothetical protein